MLEILNSLGKKKSIDKPTKLDGNYEIIPIPVGPAGRFQNGAWARGNEMYIAAGSGVAYYNDVWSLNLDSLTWTTRPTLSVTPLTGYMSGYSEKHDKAICGGGITSGGVYATGRQEYIHKTNSWNTSTPGLGGQGNAYGSIACLGDTGYFIGGYLNSGGIQYNRSIRELNLITGGFGLTHANILTATVNPENLGLAFIDDNLWIRSNERMFRFNVTSKQMSYQSQETNFRPLDSKFMFEFGGDLYFVARVDISGDIQTYLVKYDIATSKMSMFDKLPGIRTQLPSVVYYNGALWAWSGGTIGGTVSYPNQLIRIT